MSAANHDDEWKEFPDGVPGRRFGSFEAIAFVRVSVHYDADSDGARIISVLPPDGKNLALGIDKAEAKRLTKLATQHDEAGRDRWLRARGLK